MIFEDINWKKIRKILWNMFCSCSLKAESISHHSGILTVNPEQNLHIEVNIAVSQYRIKVKIWTSIVGWLTFIGIMVKHIHGFLCFWSTLFVTEN